MKTMIAFLGHECRFSKEMATDYYEFITENKDFNITTSYVEDDNNKTSKSMNVFYIPTFLMLNDGKEYCRMVGKRSKKELLDFYTHECFEQDVRE